MAANLGGGLGPPTAQQLEERPLLQYLPFYKAWVPPKSSSHDVPFNPGWMGESCGVRLVMGTVGGAGMGFVFGMFLGAMGDMQPIQLVNGREVPTPPIREQARAAYKSTASRSIGLAKNFASFSAIFMGSECVIEKMRGRHDMMNSVYSGCVTGAAFGLKQGPGATCAGCIGMAAFSVVMDAIMGH
ncbi:unnamed protein product [Chrysoparadoxa australica]